MVDPERHRMSRSKKKKGVIETKERFVRLTYELLETEAWLHLTPSSVKVYIELRRRFNGSNNGQIHLSLLAGAKKLNMSKTTVKRALDQLTARNWCAERGYFTGRRRRFIWQTNAIAALHQQGISETGHGFETQNSGDGIKAARN